MFVESAIHDRKEGKEDRELAELQYQNKLVKSCHTESPADLLTGTRRIWQEIREDPEPPFSPKPKPTIKFSHVSLNVSTPLLEGILCRSSRKLTLKSIVKGFLKKSKFEDKCNIYNHRHPFPT